MKRIIVFSLIAMFSIRGYCQTGDSAEETFFTPTNIHFSDITFKAGILPHGEHDYGHGVTFADINHDQRPDFLVSNAMRDIELDEHLYMNQGNAFFKEDASARGLSDPGLTHAMVAADYDNDGDLDLFFSNMTMYHDGHGGYGHNVFYRNNGEGYFTDKTDAVGLSTQRNDTRGAVAFDADNDGWLDIFAANWGQPCELYLNRGNGRFRRENRGAEGPQNDESAKQGVTAADFDNDGDIDLYVCRRETGNWLLVNGGGGYFSERAADYQIDVEGRSHGAVFVDIDRDADLDLFIVNYRTPRAPLPFLNVFINNGDGTFTDRTQAYNIRVSGYSVVFGDVDNDGDFDMLLVKNPDKDPGARPALYLNDGNGNLTLLASSGVEMPVQDPRGAGYADIDHDGDIDFFIACKDGQNYLLRNDLESSNHYLDILCYGPQGDYGGFGTKVWIYEPGHLGDDTHLIAYQESISQYAYLCQNQTALHFGLGQHICCDIKIILTDGSVHTFEAIKADQRFVFHGPADLNYESGNDQHGWIERQFPEALVVRVTRQNEVVADARVTFTPQNGGRMLESQPVITGKNGYAAAHFMAGSRDDEYHIKATCDQTQDQEVFFSVTATRPPVQLVKLDGEDQTGRVAEPLPVPLSVRTEHPDGRRVTGQPVRFNAVPGSGSFTDRTVLQVKTDSLGIASANWTLGEQSGFQTVTASIDTETVSFTANAQPQNPYQIVSEFDPDRPRQAAETYPVLCRVTDQYNNPIVGHAVQYQIISGTGHIKHQSSVIDFTDSTGHTTADWFLGGNYQEQTVIRIASSFDEEPLVNSPLRLKLSHITPPSFGQSTITATDSIIADGNDHTELLVALKNDSGVALSSYPITIKVSGSQNQLHISDSLTDEQGLVHAQLSSTTTERKMITARIDKPGIAVPDTEFVTFISSPLDSFFLVKINGDNQQDTVQHRLPKPLSVQVINANQEPIPGQPVVFYRVKGNGHFDEDSLVTVASDSNGLAQTNYTLGTRSGVHSDSVTATLNNSIGFHASALPDTPDRLLNLTPDTLYCRATSRLLHPFRVQIIDRYGNPLSGEKIQFSAPSGGMFIDDSLQLTNSAGVGSCRIHCIDRGGVYQFTAHTSDSLITRLTVIVNDPYHVFKNRSPDTVYADSLNQIATLAARITRRDRSPLPGVTVTFSRLEGTAEFHSDSLCTTDSTGTATCRVGLVHPCRSAVFRAKTQLDTILFALVHRNSLSVHDDNPESANQVRLHSAYPNPFNSRTVISFELPVSTRVTLALYNIKGRLIATLIDRNMQSGFHSLTFDALNDQGVHLSSGLYYLVLRTPESRKHRPILFLK
ncbi:MAG: FG-GAP-like repeat-containing protein [candidate division KSB1 bacterium]|nr:FG-GAP-like repeat-containing protein [candidate division KSB1 bacterium]